MRASSNWTWLISVPIPINRSKAEIGAALTTFHEKKNKVRAVPNYVKVGLVMRKID